MQIEFTEIMFACLRSHTPEALTLVCVFAVVIWWCHRSGFSWEL